MFSKAEEKVIGFLKERFEKNKEKFLDINWEDIELALENNKTGLEVLVKMEETDGEPGFFKYDKAKNKYIFCDMADETPKARVSLCYDKKALDGRKKNPPRGDAESMAKEIGIEMMDEEFYRSLQAFKAIDQKTSSWIKTPEKIRSLGGAIFCDRRFDTVFTYHNGADSYYASRGFRGYVEI